MDGMNHIMTREDIQSEIIKIFQEVFEIDNPGLDDDLRNVHNFDSIDAIELLLEIEELLGIQLSQKEKEKAMDIRTINQICDYIESFVKTTI